MFMGLFNLLKDLNPKSQKLANINGNKMALGVVLYGLFKTLSNDLVTRPVYWGTGVDIELPIEHVYYPLPKEAGEAANIVPQIQQTEQLISRRMEQTVRQQTSRQTEQTVRQQTSRRMEQTVRQQTSRRMEQMDRQQTRTQSLKQKKRKMFLIWNISSRNTMISLNNMQKKSLFPEI